MVVPFFVALRAFSLRSSRVCVAHSCRVLYQYYRERGTAFSWHIILQQCSPVVGKPRRMSRPVNLSILWVSEVPIVDTPQTLADSGPEISDAPGRCFCSFDRDLQKLWSADSFDS